MNINRLLIAVLFVYLSTQCCVAQTKPSIQLEYKAGSIDIKVGGELFTTYHYSDDFILPHVRPFFWPVKVSDGTEVTNDQAQDPQMRDHHPYQRSVWVGNGDVNGADHWKYSGKPHPPQQRHIKFDQISQDGFVERLVWEDKNDEPMLNETRTVKFVAYPDGSRGIDIAMAFSPIKEDVTFGDSKDHGLFSVRPQPSMSHDPTLFNSTGATGNDCSDTTADWCNESGKINDKTYSIAILADPKNFVHPEMWHAHSDARLAPDPLSKWVASNKKPHKGDGAFTIKLNTTAAFRYCAIFQAGELTPADLASRYANFAGINPVPAPVVRPRADDAAAITPSQPQAAPTTAGSTENPPVTVDGEGAFKTVQAAIDSIPLSNDRPRIISIKPGRYYEKLMVKAPYVHLVGTDPANTVLTYDDWALKIGANGKVIGTNASHTLFVRGHDFEAENLTIENTKGPRKQVHQAMAVGVQADRVIFKNCRLLSHQDTLLAGSGRQLYENCTIVGDADFIFGDATAAFDHCEIRSNDFGVVTAQERTSAESSTGFVFNQCRFTATSDVHKTVYLGRPFRPYARVVLLNCEIGSHINPAGWTPVLEGDYTKTAYFAESGSTGAGADPAKRIAWSHQLSQTEAQPFLPANLLKGTDDWSPIQVWAPVSSLTTRP